MHNKDTAGIMWESIEQKDGARPRPSRTVPLAVFLSSLLGPGQEWFASLWRAVGSNKV